MTTLTSYLNGLNSNDAAPAPANGNGAYALTPNASIEPPQSFGEKLREATVAVKLRRKRWGVIRKLESEQVKQAADQFNAETDRLSASKRLIDTRTEKFRNCTSVISAAVQYWRENSVPYPENGVRLMQKSKLPAFRQRIAALKAELAEAVEQLQGAYAALIEQSRNDLGTLFDITDYPAQDVLAELFDLDHEFPSTKPDEYLLQLDPALYEAEQRRIAARFDEAVKLAEDAFTDEFAKLVTQLAERLLPGEDGKPKVFRDSSVTGLLEFFDRFKSMSVGNNVELERLVNEAQGIIKGDGSAVAKALRKDVTVRQTTQAALAEVAKALETQLVNRPKRKLFLDEDFGAE